MALALLTAPAARAERVSVVVVPDFSPAEYAGRGAVGLFVPGEGKRVSREAALASLVRGKVENSIVGGVPGGRPLIAPGRRPADVTIYVALPPTGSQPNDRRYPIAVVGGGYHGLLTSGSTRLDGLVSIADIAPTARSLERGERPAIRWRASEHAARALARLDRRLDRNRDTRIPAMLVLALGTLAGCVIALLVSTRYAGRAAQLAAPATLLASLVVSAAAITTPWLVILLIPLFAAAASLAAAAWSRALIPALVATVVAFLVVMAAWPEVNSLAAIGPHPERGGRFYGTTNLTATVLLTVTMQAGALLGLRRLLPLAVLALVAIGWSRAGADGGGLVVTAVALGVLALRLSGKRLTLRLAAAAVVAAVALGLALVGLDAATGGSSHVTRAVGDGPDAVLGDLGHRLHVSGLRIVGSWYSALVVAASVGAVLVLATRWPRFPAGDALVAGLVVSLLVNDTPTDVASAGAISYGVLFTWERVRAREPAPPRLDSPPDASPRLARPRLRRPARRLWRRQASLAAAGDRPGDGAEGGGGQGRPDGR